MSTSKARVIVQDENYRVLLRSGMRGPDAPIIEEADGVDSMGATRWRVSMNFPPENTLVSGVLRLLLTTIEKERGQRANARAIQSQERSSEPLSERFG